MEVTVGNRRVEVVGRKPRGQAEGSGEQTFDRRNVPPQLEMENSVPPVS